MDNKEKIEILNSMEIIYSQGGEENECVCVEDNEENRKKLLDIGCSEKDIETQTFDGEIDISGFAFDFGAIYFTGEKFINSEEELFNDLKLAVNRYWECVDSNPLDVPKVGKEVIELASQYVDIMDDLMKNKK